MRDRYINLMPLERAPHPAQAVDWTNCIVWAMILVSAGIPVVLFAMLWG